ncbi:MAG: hypothetical protein FJY07_03955, partial [Bacteroidetes bacterium]|nr:hypothetical protein [Bacteroidota bacterium]
MKKTAFLFLIIPLTHVIFGQKIISGKSDLTSVKLIPEYVRGIPPNLFVKYEFQDDNRNGILEANETAKLNIEISNKGKGPAQGLLVKVNDNIFDKELFIEGGKEVAYIYPDQKVQVNIAIKAGLSIKSAEHKLEISVAEHFGYDMDPAYLILSTLKFQEPELVFSGLGIVDSGQGTGTIEEDGELQAGELVKVKLVVQNVGQNIAKHTTFKVESTDNNIYITEGQGNLGDLSIGEVKEFWISLSPNKRVTTQGKLPIYLSLTNDYNKGNIKDFQLPISLNQKPPETSIVEVKPDIESLKQQVARFEYTSNKITANVGNIIDIRKVAPSKTKRSDAIAVIIGIEKYEYFAPAPYAANDAEVMKEYFRNVLGIQKVYVYTNSEVSGFFFDNHFDPNFGAIQKAIVKGKTELFVFYSGHGMPSKDGSTVYLFPSDGRIEALDRQGYDLNKLYNNLEALGARSVTLFMDACFTGDSRASEQIETQNLVTMKGIRIQVKTG